MLIADKIRKIIEKSLEKDGYEIVQITYFEQRTRNTLQIMIDRIDGKLITVSDCEHVSRTCSILIDVEDPIKEQYDLEISSAGIDRPLTRLKDFDNNAGFEAKIKTKSPVRNRKNFKCTLAGTDGNKVLVDQDIDDVNTECFEIDFDNILSAKLSLTEELIKHHEKLAKGR
ncbi:MAG: ribosome maturation factor RimP [Alphaproteobacteria bacterium]|nr:ribosome maturation factor RimP [Alphaproteobacteria bacterium]OJV13199.1 MAG: hypothetical protein BGO27_00140 [Alphaproteobacteria bacterium 33-17]